VSPKPKPKPTRAKSKARPGGVSKAPAKRAPAPAKRTPAPKPRLPFAWVVTGGILATALAIVLIATLGSGGSSSPAGGTSAPVSAELVRNTKAAGVPLLDEEGLATHTHTTLEVIVNGKEKQVPAGIGIDAEAGKIAALHTHDTSGLVHLESAKENDSYTLEQFLTVWGMPNDPAGRCAFFGATSPCTLTVKSTDSGAVGLDVKLADHDTLTLTVTST
jgi:hypothetical protein